MKVDVAWQGEKRFRAQTPNGTELTVDEPEVEYLEGKQ